MLTFNQRVYREFETLVDARVEHIGDTILAGMVPSMEAYKHLTGQLQGLREATELLLEAISIAEGKPRDEQRENHAIYGDVARG